MSGDITRSAPGNLVGSSHLSARPGHKAYSTGFRIPTNNIDDYAHPSLDPSEWEFELDNDFAATLSSRLRSIKGISLHQTPSTASLCVICRDFQGRLLDAEFKISYAIQTLQTNSKAKSCDLCYLLWRNCRDRLDGGCKSVHLQRAGSVVRLRGTTHPVLTVLRSDGKSPH